MINISAQEMMRYMLALFNNINKDLKEEYQKLSKVDTELSDLDHYLENNILKSYELAKLGKLRQTKRRERREIKNNIDMIEIIKKFTDKYNNKLITGDIIQNLKEQSNLQKKQENPTYQYKTDIIKKLKEE